MPKSLPQAIVHGLIAAASLLLAAVTIGLVYGVDDFGSPFLFAGALIAEVCLFIIFIYNLIRALSEPLHIFLSILVSAWGGVLTNPYIHQLQKTKSRFLLWLARRLNPRKPTGLLLSIGVLLSLYFLISFMSVLLAVVGHTSLTQIDIRVMNLMPWIRTNDQTKFFRFITFLANPESIMLLVALMTAFFWYLRKWLMGGLVITVALAQGLCVLIVKNIVARPRPDRALAVVSEHDFSFPSGHVMAATVLFGLLTYFLLHAFKRPYVRLVILLGYVISVGLVASSRVYLGAHYPTDILGSIYLGLALLALVITGIEVAVRVRFHGVAAVGAESRMLVLAIPAIIGFSLLAAPYFVHISTFPATQHYEVLSVINQQTVRQLPLDSKTLAGKVAEPVSFVYLGSEDQITRLFLAHGWYKADRSTIANTIQAVSVGFQGHQYLTAPVTPAYVALQPETLAFEQPTKRNTLRQRHHTRLWRTAFKLTDGREIWVATASFDEGVELAGTFKLPTHRIAPDLDAERSYILQSLGVSTPYYLSVAHAQAGENASGDIFFTDGRAAVVNL